MELLPLIPNHTSHYAIGDICLWSGIKRCGAAMFMGYHAAYNIHQRLLQTLSTTNTEPELKQFPEVPPMIAIAIGKTAIMLSPQDGTTAGKEVLQMMFRDDLGWASEYSFLPLPPFLLLESTVRGRILTIWTVVCWEYLQLGIDTTIPLPKEVIVSEKEKIEVQVVATAAKMEAITV